MEEIRTSADANILRTTASKLRPPSAKAPYHTPQQPVGRAADGQVSPLIQTGWSYLSPDSAFVGKVRLTSCLDEETADSSSLSLPEAEESTHPPSFPSARIVSRLVSTKQSPHFNAYYRHHPLKLTLGTGAETSMFKASVARAIDAPIKKTSQVALQAASPHLPSSVRHTSLSPVLIRISHLMLSS